MYKTHSCGELRATHTGRKVRLAGWVHRRRDFGVGEQVVEDREGHRDGVVLAVLVDVVVHPQLVVALLERLELAKSDPNASPAASARACSSPTRGRGWP